MNILMLSPLPPPSGGIASWTVRYKEYCEKNNIRLRLVNIAMRGKRATSEVMNRNMLVEFQRTYRIVSDLKKELKTEVPDVVHINTSCSTFGIFRDALCVLAVGEKAPIIIHCRCNIEDILKGSIPKKVFRFLVNRSDKVIVLNKFSKKYVENIEKGKAVYIPNFANEKMIDEHHVVKEKIDNVIYVGHIERAKGIEQIVQTAERMPHVNFVLVGAMRENLTAVQFPSNMLLVGRVDSGEVQKYMKSADIFLFPSETEGFSNALLEAMAMGIPIIASDVGANSEMIESRGGVVLRENTADEICTAFNIMKDQLERQRMSLWNVNKVKNAYMVDKVMHQYFKVYEGLRRKES